MTKLRKKLLLSVLTLALTFIALGSTTFAWFTLGAEATANAFEATVQGGEGIEISLGDGSTNYDQYKWTNNVNLSEKLEAVVFEDLTSENGLEIKSIKGVKNTNVNKDYVELPIYVRTVDSTLHIYLKQFVQTESDEFDWNPDASVLKNNVVNNPAQEGDYEFKVGTPIKWNALNALRVSFSTEVASDKEPNASEVIEFAISNNHSNADSTTEGLAYRYASAKGYTLEGVGASLPNIAEKNKVTTLTNKASNTLNLDLTSAGSYYVEDTTTVQGTTYYIYQITLRVWMEGWDGDCINAILSKTIKLGFLLEGKKPTA